MSAFNPLKFIVASLATAAMVAAVGIAVAMVQPAMAQRASLSSLVDINGRQIVPPIYSYIEYLGNGVYMMALRASDAAAAGAKAGTTIVDRDGNNIPFNVPAGAVLQRVFLPQLPQNSSITDRRLPAGTLLVVRQDQKTTMVDLDGNFLLPFEDVDIFQHVDCIAVTRRDRSTFYLSLDGRRWIDKPADAKPAWKEAFTDVYPFHDGYAIATIGNDGKDLKYGLIDEKHKWVISPDAMHLKWMYGKVYCKKTSPSAPMILLTADGTRLFDLPPEALAAYGTDGLIDCEFLPSVRVSGKDTRWAGHAIFNENGEKLYGEKECLKPVLNHGLAVIADDPVSDEFVDRANIIITKSGVVARNISALQMYPTENDRLILVRSNTRFSPEVWAINPNCRVEQFSYFLKAHPIIGMRRREVEKYLGKANSLDCYSTFSNLCGVTREYFEMKYENDKLTGWRRSHSSYGHVESEPWVSTDLIYDWEGMGGYRSKIRLYPRNQR